MKKRLLLLWLLTLFCGKSFAANGEWLKGPDFNWFIRLEPALEKASQENKKVYVLNTGSDWCGFCKVLKREVLERPLFREFARKHLVLVYLDQPSQKVDMPQDQRNYNRATVRNLRFGGGVPCAMLLNADGSKIDTISGYRPEAVYMTELYEKLNLPDCPIFPAAVDIELRSTKKNKKAKTARVELVAWGTSKNNVNNPISAAKLVQMPPGKKIFLKINYTAPKKLKAILHFGDHSKTHFHSLSGRITQSGTYLISTTTPVKNDFWGNQRSSFHTTVEPLQSGFRKGQKYIPCRIKLNPILLNDSDRNKYERTIRQNREVFANSQFEIVSWGDNRKAMKPYIPGETISSSSKNIYLKVRYYIPKPAAISISNYQNAYTDYTPLPTTGEQIFRIYNYSSRGISKLYVNVRVKGGELLKNIVTLPCKIEFRQ